ncbi:MAG TPA: PGPGW domain-containing protein [Jiangellales bacterium]|nr:PGPGW domain-containing protein [Jiangellales bacterium]
MHQAKRFAVTIAGFGLLAVGAAMMVLPGPGLLVIVVGLAVLATEYLWARRLLARAKARAQRAQDAAVASRLRTAGSVAFACGMAGLGLAMVLIDDVPWPVLDSWLDRVWGPVTGSVLMLTGVVLLTSTIVTRMAAQGEATTYLADDEPG